MTLQVAEHQIANGGSSFVPVERYEQVSLISCLIGFSIRHAAIQNAIPSAGEAATDAPVTNAPAPTTLPMTRQAQDLCTMFSRPSASAHRQLFSRTPSMTPAISLAAGSTTD